MKPNEIKKLATQHAKGQLGEAQFKSNKDAARAIAEDFTAGFTAAVREAQAAPAAPVTGSREGEALSDEFSLILKRHAEALNGFRWYLPSELPQRHFSDAERRYIGMLSPQIVLNLLAAAAPVVDAGPAYRYNALPCAESELPDEDTIVLLRHRFDGMLPQFGQLKSKHSAPYWLVDKLPYVLENFAGWAPLPAAPVTLEGETAQ